MLQAVSHTRITHHNPPPPCKAVHARDTRDSKARTGLEAQSMVQCTSNSPNILTCPYSLPGASGGLGSVHAQGGWGTMQHFVQKKQGANFSVLRRAAACFNCWCLPTSPAQPSGRTIVLRAMSRNLSPNMVTSSVCISAPFMPWSLATRFACPKESLLNVHVSVYPNTKLCSSVAWLSCRKEPLTIEPSATYHAWNSWGRRRLCNKKRSLARNQNYPCT